MSAAGRLGAVAGAALAGVALWWRRHPSACPYSQRFWVEMPHPGITRERLRELLEPAPGERLLEVGPGTGYYALAVAGWLGANGRLDVLDVLGLHGVPRGNDRLPGVEDQGLSPHDVAGDELESRGSVVQQVCHGPSLLRTRDERQVRRSRSERSWDRAHPAVSGCRIR